jgi:membrane protein
MANRRVASVPGREADRPREVPKRGWWQVLKRAWAEAKVDQVPLLAAGVAFFGFLSVFPAIVAAVLAYGLIADPVQIRNQAEDLAKTMPASGRDLLLQQIDSLTSAPSRSLGIGLAIAVAVALWSASGGVGYLITAVNLAYDEDESRGFVRRKLLALGMTLGAIVFVLLAVALFSVGAAIGDDVATPIRYAVAVIRVVLALALITVALAIIYRLAPDRDAHGVRWLSVGAGVATVIWLVASIGFSLYVSTFGNYAKTYGSLASVVVLMLWMWLTAYAILFGAEINTASEQRD